MDRGGTNRVSRFPSACRAPRSSCLAALVQAGAPMATQSGLRAPTCTIPRTSATKQGPDDLSCCSVVGPGFPCRRGFQCPSVRGDTMVSCTQSFPLQERSEIRAGTRTRRSVPARGGSGRCGHEQRETQCSDWAQTSHITQPPGKTGGGPSVTCKVSTTVPVQGDKTQPLLEGFGSTAQASVFVPTSRLPPGLRGNPSAPVMASLPRADFCIFLWSSWSCQIERAHTDTVADLYVKPETKPCLHCYLQGRFHQYNNKGALFFPFLYSWRVRIDRREAAAVWQEEYRLGIGTSPFPALVLQPALSLGTQQHKNTADLPAHLPSACFPRALETAYAAFPSGFKPLGSSIAPCKPLLSHLLSPFNSPSICRSTNTNHLHSHLLALLFVWALQPFFFLGALRSKPCALTRDSKSSSK